MLYNTFLCIDNTVLYSLREILHTDYTRIDSNEEYQTSVFADFTKVLSPIYSLTYLFIYVVIRAQVKINKYLDIILMEKILQNLNIKNYQIKRKQNAFTLSPLYLFSTQKQLFIICTLSISISQIRRFRK